MARILSVEPLHTRLEARLESAVCRIELLDVSWPAPVDVTVVEDEPVLEFALNTAPSVISEGRFCMDGSTDRFGRLGTTMFKPGRVPLHALSTWHQPYSVRCIFSSEHFARLQPPSDQWDSRDLNACLNIHDASIDASMIRLAQEARAPGFATQMLIDACATSLMVELIRYLRGDKRKSDVKATGGLSTRQLRLVQDRIVTAECTMPSIAELAALVGISSRHLTRAFKQSTGRTVGAYVESVQLSKAKLWLAETDLPIKVIAARLGFAHAANFSSAFLRSTLQSPNVFRQEHRKRR
jgi:AraC family transcriptional regulator